MFMLDTETVIASGLGSLMLFFLFRGYVLWRKWSNKSKTDDEIDLDRKIAEAIKNGDVVTVAKLKKYLQMYARGSRNAEPKSETGGESDMDAPPEE